MTPILQTLTLIFLLSFGANAQERNDDVRDVILGQIEAFRAGDIDRAYEFASPSIQSIFPTPGIFGQMVENGYPMVWRPSEIRFGDTSSRAGRNYQIVVFRDGRGAYHALEYEMIATPEGWKINGVRFIELPDAGV